jgi:hypothetical protein
MTNEELTEDLAANPGGTRRCTPSTCKNTMTYGVSAKRCSAKANCY